LLFTAILFSRPWDILSVFEDGLCGGVLGVPLFGMAGGYALAGGLRWGRIPCGVVAASTIPIWALTVTSFAPHLAVDSPRGAWAALYYYSFMATLMLACAIPLRASPVQPNVFTNSPKSFRPWGVTMTPTDPPPLTIVQLGEGLVLELGHPSQPQRSRSGRIRKS
jgi:hypothetical protein